MERAVRGAGYRGRFATQVTGGRGALVWIIVLAAFLAVFACRQRGEVAEIWSTLRGADPRWLAGIPVAQAVNLLIVAHVYHIILERLGYSVSRRRTLVVHLQRHVVGTITPAGGPASVYAFVRGVGQDGVSAHDALLAIAIKSTASYAAFVALLVPALAISRPSAIVLGGAVFLAFALVVMVTLMQMALGDRDLPRWLVRVIPRRVELFVAEARQHGIRARDLFMPAALGFSANLAGIAMLVACLRSVGQDAALSTAITGYAVGNLFIIVAPVFQGIGLVETSVSLALEQLGVPLTAAVSATLLFRVGDIWLPLALGLVVQGMRIARQRIRRG
jgi:uncharacterized membrane protein YbhN (UPF0104 family)